MFMFIDIILWLGLGNISWNVGNIVASVIVVHIMIAVVKIRSILSKIQTLLRMMLTTRTVYGKNLKKKTHKINETNWISFCFNKITNAVYLYTNSFFLSFLSNFFFLKSKSLALLRNFSHNNEQFSMLFLFSFRFWLTNHFHNTSQKFK